MQVNAIVTATAPNGKDIKTTISHIRQSQENKAEQLTIALNGLTQNLYKSTQINEIDVLSDGKQTPTLELGTWTQPTTGYYQSEITYSGDGTLTLSCSVPAMIKTTDSTKHVYVYGTSFSGTLYASETSRYAAASINFAR